MATRQQFLKAIKAHGATFEEDTAESCKSIIIDAPEGKIWNATTASVIIAIHWYNGGTASEMYTQAIEDMNQGTDNE